MALSTPEAPSTQTPETNETASFWTRKKVTAAVLGASLTIGGAAYTARNALTGKNKPEESPSTSAPKVPGEIQEGQEAEKIEFGISAAEYANNPEKLAREYYDQYNQFLIAGLDLAAANNAERRTMQDKEYVEKIMANIDAEFVDNIMAEGWEDDPELVNLVSNEIKISHAVKQRRLFTFSDAAIQNGETPYKRWLDITKADGTTDPLTTTVRWDEMDNINENRAEERPDYLNVNDYSGGEQLSWVVQDGKLKISGVTYLAEAE